MSSALACTFIRRRRSLIFREAWLMLRERPLHRTRSARICAALPPRSRTDIRPPLSPPGCFVRRLPLVLPGTLQAALGDYVALVPPGVPRTLVPLDGPLVL